MAGRVLLMLHALTSRLHPSHVFSVAPEMMMGKLDLFSVPWSRGIRIGLLPLLTGNVGVLTMYTRGGSMDRCGLLRASSSVSWALV